MKSKIETIFLDAGGVLVWPNWTRVSAALREHGVFVDAAQLAAADPPARFSIDRSEFVAGSDDQRRGWEYFDLVLAHAGVTLSERTTAALGDLLRYHREHNLWENVPDFVMPALQKLRASGYRLVVVSNANGTVHSLLDRLGLAPLLDAIFDSAVEKLEKPDPRFFRLALERAGARPQTTVHVGDLYHVDVVGARSAGLSAILVDEGDLQRDADCPRIRNVGELPGFLAHPS
ncbi:MAG TPA: HAD family hydrolase [Thermoanaerobaculia bacterium]|nr:HAD family hydrolase [Thermoanaerobaculia bacterium]